MKNKGLLSILIICFAPLSSPAVAASLSVGCGGDYPTIQAAVNAAGTYDTITVCPGDYGESVLIQTEGLTVQSTEISERGPNTIVTRFAIGFAPNVGPHSVTIKGFTVSGPAGVCIESSGDYSTIAFNSVNSCGIGIRVNRGNVGNNVHHNVVSGTPGTGIEVEGYYDGCCGGTAGPGWNHNIHQNIVTTTAGEGCFYVWADYSQVHQNQADGCFGNGGINAVRSEGLHIHHNQICSSIELWAAEYAFVHHNELTGSINNAGDNTLKKNKENLSSCPID